MDGFTQFQSRATFCQMTVQQQPMTRTLKCHQASNAEVLTQQSAQLS